MIGNKFTKIQRVILNGGCFVHLFFFSSFCFYKHVSLPYLGENDNTKGASQMILVEKKGPANAGDAGLIPGSRRSPGEGNGDPLQYSWLENSMDRRAWQATVHGVKMSWT